MKPALRRIGFTCRVLTRGRDDGLA